MLPDTQPAVMPPLQPSPDDLAGGRMTLSTPPFMGEFAPPSTVTADAIRDTTGPALDFDYARSAAMPMGQPQTPAPAMKFNPVTLVKDQPWISFGVAVAAGLGVGLILFSRPKRPKPGEKPVDDQGRGPSLFDTIVGGIGQELATAGKGIVDELAGAVKEKAHEAVASVQGLIGQPAEGGPAAQPAGV